MTDTGRRSSLSLPDPSDHSRGNDGSTELVFFGDFDCTFCARTAQAIAPAVEEGVVRLTFRHFPLTSAHGRAEAAHRAAEAADRQGAFWDFYDAMFKGVGRLEDPDLWRYAQAAGLDLGRFERDRRDEQIWMAIREEFKAAVRGGVTGAPMVGFKVGESLVLEAGPRSRAELDGLLATYR